MITRGASALRRFLPILGLSLALLWQILPLQAQETCVGNGPKCQATPGSIYRSITDVDVGNSVAVNGNPIPPSAPSNAALSGMKATPNNVVNRIGYYVAGDAPLQAYVASGAPCTLNGGKGDGGSQIPGKDGNCWTARTSDPRQFGTSPATFGFYTVTTTAASNQVTIVQTAVTAPAPTTANRGNYIVIEGAGPYEGWYIGQITNVSATTVTVSPAPTLNIPGQSVRVYYGIDSSTAINNACAAGKSFGIGTKMPSGIFLAASPIACPIINYNNANVMPPTAGGESGSVIKAVAAMPGSLPVAGHLFTVGGYANGSDFTQYIRNGIVDGGGLTLDCSFICNYAFGLPFSQETEVRGFEAKNALTAGFHIGATGSPQATSAVFVHNNKVDRDISYSTITNITAANPPVVTTSRDHGVTTGRLVTIIGANNVPGSVTGAGRISFWATATDATHLQLHDIDGTGWSAFSGTASLALTFPTNSYIHTITGVSSANPAQITAAGGDNWVNGQTVCLYGIGGTGPNGTTSPPTNVPDGCYAISNVGGVGGDGPFHFTVAVDTTTFTYTGGGIAFMQEPTGTHGDMGFYLDNTSDAQLSDNAIVGTRWPIYANPSNSGFNEKLTHNHSSNFAEQGWIISGHYLGGSNSLLGEQCDSPIVFCAQFVSGANSSSASYLNGSGFNFLVDAATWMWRLDAGAVAPGGLIVNGGGANGVSSSIRVSTLSNNLTAGNPPYFGAISDYLQYGFTNAGNMLYPMPDSTAAKSVTSALPTNPTATTSATQVAMGLGKDQAGSGAAPCTITPRYSGIVNFEITGTILNQTINDGAFAQLYIGTGTAPSNGATFGGGTASVGNSIGITTDSTASAQWPFKIGSVASSTLTLNTPYWFDAALKATTGGTASIANITCTATEQ